MFSYLRQTRYFAEAAESWGLADGSIASAVHHGEMSFEQFVQQKELYGCQTKSILGMRCLELMSDISQIDESLFDQVVEILTHKFSFVGLTEKFDESVCLFHAMFGGLPVAVQMPSSRRIHKTDHGSFITASQRAKATAHRDLLDERLHAVASRLFEERTSLHNHNRFRRQRHQPTKTKRGA
jgi:hypothetical protein